MTQFLFWENAAAVTAVLVEFSGGHLIGCVLDAVLYNVACERKRRWFYIPLHRHQD